MKSATLREKYPYSEFCWSIFPRIRTKWGEIIIIIIIIIINPLSLLLLILYYSVQVWKNKDKKNSEYVHVLHSARGALHLDNQ